MFFNSIKTTIFFAKHGPYIRAYVGRAYLPSPFNEKGHLGQRI